MAKKTPPAVAPEIDGRIVTVRGQRVILSADLAAIYGVEPRVLNQAVKRNGERFPEDFLFQLTREEADEFQSSRSQTVIMKRGGNFKYLPYAFTEHGAIMAATVLNSPSAIAMSVYVVRAFLHQRQQLAANADLLRRLAEIDEKLLAHDEALVMVWQELQARLRLPLPSPPPAPKRRIGFHSS